MSKKGNVKRYGALWLLGMTMTRATDDPERKELKTSIPTRHHLALHSLRLLQGKRIHTMVEEALEAYFVANGVKAQS